MDRLHQSVTAIERIINDLPPAERTQVLARLITGETVYRDGSPRFQAGPDRYAIERDRLAPQYAREMTKRQNGCDTLNSRNEDAPSIRAERIRFFSASAQEF